MIAVIVPTCRPDLFNKEFLPAWQRLFRWWEVSLFVVYDQQSVKCIRYDYGSDWGGEEDEPILLEDKPEWKEVVCTKTDAVRNFGFLCALQVAKLGNFRWHMLLTLDDDVAPIREGCDPISDHLLALYTRGTRDPRKVPISWFSSASEYMRGFPYGVREEAEVWVSHGVWEGAYDYDGPTQLVKGITPADFYKGPVPKGCLTNICGMNLAFRDSAAPWIYFAPMGTELGVQRFSDIWMGIELKKKLDQHNKGLVTGYSRVNHRRASNVFNNLVEESYGIRMNETIWKEEQTEEVQLYLSEYYEKLEKWGRIVETITGDGQ